MRVGVSITVLVLCSSSFLFAEQDMANPGTVEPTDATPAQQEAAAAIPLVEAPTLAKTPAMPYRGTIGPGDTVTIVSLQSEEISKPWRVGSTGDLNLPMVGRIHIAGMTVEQLEEELVLRLRKFIREPQVTAYISEFRSQPIMVVGGVEKPGTFQREESETLLQALTLAGGPKGILGKSMHGPTVTVTRNLKYGSIPMPDAKNDPNGKFSIVELSLKDVMVGSSAAANLILQAEDVVAVSTKPPFVYVVGEVTRPGAVELATQDHMSMVQLLAVAGGMTRDASPGKTEILSVNGDGLYVKKASINAKKVMSGKVSDVKLVAGDVVVVPSNRFKFFWQSATASTLTAGTMILARF
jgi:polysaccharide export outer membrane protein